VRRRGRNAFFAAAILAAVLAPAAAAERAPAVKLSLVPLPKSALGAAGRSLALTHDSGAVSNLQAATASRSGTTGTFESLGRVTGYDLTYGDPFSGGSGITQIASGIEQYRTAADAKKGLAFWRKDDAQITSLGQYGVSVTLKVVKTPAIGTSRLGYGTTLTLPGIAPISTVDERVVDGKYVLEVSVAAGSLSAASREASKLLPALDRRLQLAEKGQLRAKPVKRLPPLQAGPPAGGPDLSALTLAAADLTGPALLGDHTYVVDPAALSAYLVNMNPAGQFEQLTQEIEWYATAHEATVTSAVEGAIVASEFGVLLGVTPTATPVDLSAVGDNATGQILFFVVNGQPLYIGLVALSRGHASDFVVVSSASELQASDLQTLAQKAASHLDAGVAG
jgi:hypothetical protein